MATTLPSGFQKAYLSIEQGERIDCWFNPKEYTLSRQNKWNFQTAPGVALPTAQFGGSDAHKLNIDLLFDDSDAHSGDVRSICKTLLGMMEVDPHFGSGAKNNSRPPMVEFGWGGVLTFNAVCEQLSIQYTLFKPNGIPIRALVKLALTQVEKAEAKAAGGAAKRQNPTTTGEAGVRSHVIRDGDSLQSIAFRAYGDATAWRTIAHANEIDNPLALRRGDVLSIPRLAE